MNQAPTLIINDDLIIRQPKESDILERFELGRSTEFRHMVGGSVKDIPPYTIKNAEALYNREMKNKYSWFIEYKGKMIGVCRLRMKDDISRYSIGIYTDSLFSKGIGTLVTSEVIDFAFNTLNLNRVELMVLEYNKRAIRCYEKCGFKKISVLKDNLELEGELYNDVIMEITKQ